MKPTLIMVLAAILGGVVLWVAPYRLPAADTVTASHKILYYICPMHSSVKSDKPGDCPICGMNLVPVYAKPRGDGTNTPPALTNTNAPLATGSGCCGSGGCH